MAQGFSDQSFGFLEGLEANNTRDWFMANKAVFQSHLETPFVQLLEALSNRLDGTRLPYSGSKKTMFRLNRDVRFSEDKRPYKTAVSGLLTPSGTKDMLSGVLYLHLASDGGFMAAGFHALSPQQLAPIRQAMIDRAEEFDAVRTQLRAAGHELDPENTLSGMPRGFTDHAAHRHADAIRLKSLIVRQNLTRQMWISGDVIDRAQAFATEVAPLLGFQKPAA